MASNNIYPQYPENGAQLYGGSLEIKYVVAMGSGLNGRIPFVRIDNGIEEYLEYSVTVGGGICEITMNITLEEGCHSITMGVMEKQTGAEDIEYSDTVYVNVGSMPHINILEPVDGFVTEETTVHVTCLAMGYDTKTIVYYGAGYSVDGADYIGIDYSQVTKITNGEIYELDIELSAGKHEIAVRTGCNDTDTGYIYATPVSVTVKGVEITIEHPEEGETVDLPLHVLLTAIGNVNESGIYLQIDGGAPTKLTDVTEITDGYSCRYDIKELTNGSHTLEATVYDTSGRYITKQVNFTVEYVIPELFVGNIYDEMKTTSKKILVDVLTSKETTVTFILNGNIMGSVETSKSEVYHQELTLEKGYNNIVVQAGIGSAVTSQSFQILYTPYVPKITNVRINPNPVVAGGECVIIAEIEQAVEEIE